MYGIVGKAERKRVKLCSHTLPLLGKISFYLFYYKDQGPKRQLSCLNQPQNRKDVSKKGEQGLKRSGDTR